MPSLSHRRLALVVTNPEMLRLRSMPRHGFGLSGGTIGASGADWLLADSAGRIRPQHCEIVWDDGAFCLVDRSGQTFVNDSHNALGQDVSVRLRDGDILHIGPYRVAVHLQEDAHTLPDPSRHLAEHSIDELLNQQHDAWQALSTADQEPAPEHIAYDAREGEPLSALMRPLDQDTLDPLEALDALHRRGESFDARHYGLSSELTPPDLAATRFEAVSGSPLSHLESHLEDNRLPLGGVSSGSPAQAWWSAQAGGLDATRLATPLIEGLGAPVGSLDAPSTYRLLLEAGQALAALVHGLTALHEVQLREQDRQVVHGRAHQPIEDNPLRLGLDYANTVQALFSNQRSLVHLPPKTAIEENLDQFHRHQSAAIRGIDAGLAALLQAFSPVQLLERFCRYQPNQEGVRQSERAWTMYVHYYDELASARQRGFEKLFWEVFEQHYDQALRAEAE